MVNVNNSFANAMAFQFCTNPYDQSNNVKPNNTDPDPDPVDPNPNPDPDPNNNNTDPGPVDPA
jgi:hypothetical protein